MIIYLLYKRWRGGGGGAGEGLLVHSWKSLGRPEHVIFMGFNVLLPFIENTKKEGIPLRSMFWRSIKR